MREYPKTAKRKKKKAGKIFKQSCFWTGWEGRKNFHRKQQQQQQIFKKKKNERATQTKIERNQKIVGGKVKQHTHKKKKCIGAFSLGEWEKPSSTCQEKKIVSVRKRERRNPVVTTHAHTKLKKKDPPPQKLNVSEIFLGEVGEDVAM